MTLQHRPIVRLAKLLVFWTAFASYSEAGTMVRFDTSVGAFHVELLDDVAPNTVDNFLTYVNDGDYDNSIVHRSVPNFVVQGGGFYSDLTAVPSDPPIAAEVQASNLRGSIAMARTSNPDSATSQWFINLKDNSGNLDHQTGGFTVFGHVVESEMETVDRIAELDLINARGPFGSLPVLDGSTGPTAENLLTIQNIVVVPEPSGMMIVTAAIFFCGSRFRRRSSR